MACGWAVGQRSGGQGKSGGEGQEAEGGRRLRRRRRVCRAATPVGRPCAALQGRPPTSLSQRRRTGARPLSHRTESSSHTFHAPSCANNAVWLINYFPKRSVLFWSSRKRPRSRGLQASACGGSHMCVHVYDMCASRHGSEFIVSIQGGEGGHGGRHGRRPLPAPPPPSLGGSTTKGGGGGRMQGAIPVAGASTPPLSATSPAPPPPLPLLLWPARPPSSGGPRRRRRRLEGNDRVA